MKLRFLFATWNPGLHYEIDNDRKFKVNTEGWKDAFHFMQVTLRKLLNSNYIGPYLKIKHEDKIQFGPINENETLPNYYPYWCAWITCTVSFGNFNNDKDICNLI